jgi:putative phosphoribosyl transferase
MYSNAFRKEVFMVGIVETEIDSLHRHDVAIPIGDLVLRGELTIPPAPIGIVVFAHGSGSSRLSPRNIEVARALNRARLATLLFDLLTPAEAGVRTNVFDVPLLALRLAGATRWLVVQSEAGGLPVGYFGASTGAAAALWAAAEPDIDIRAVVSRGGRPDLAAARLEFVRAPTLLIVGGADTAVLELNRSVLPRFRACSHGLAVVPGATHLFEEPGALRRVAEIATDWFTTHMLPSSSGG